MAKELSEESKFNISIKTLISIGVGLSLAIGMWFTLKADIAEAERDLNWKPSTSFEQLVQKMIQK